MVGFLAGAAGGASVSIVVSAVDKFSKTFNMAETKMTGLLGVAQRNTAAFLAAGAAITGLGIVGAIGISKLVKEAVSFETAFIGVRKTVELSEEEFKELENRFKDLSRTIPFTFQELSNIGEIAGQLGVKGVDNIESFTRTIADISATTNLTAEQAATDFARFANIMNMPIEKVSQLGSVIVDLGNNLATTEAEILEMGMRISGAGQALDMTEGEVMAWAGALSSVGVRAEMGGTAISKLMINISSMVATGKPELEGFAKVAGMTADEFTKAFEQDASKALQVFFEGLGKVESEGGDVLAVLEGLDIKEVRLRDAVLRLASGYGTLDEALDIQKNAWEKDTALSEEAQKRYDSMQSQLIILGNQFKTLGAELGVVLFPILEKLIGLVTKITDWFAGLTEGQKKFIVIAGIVATVLALIIGPALIILAMLPAMAAGLGMVAGGLTAVSIAGLPVWVVALLIAVAIAALIAIGILLVKNWDKIKIAALKLGVHIKNVFIGIHNVIVSVWNGIVSYIESSINRIIKGVNSVIKTINKVPGINIGTIGEISLGKFKGEMMESAQYIPTLITTETTPSTVNNININNLNGFNSRDIANQLQEELNNKI